MSITRITPQLRTTDIASTVRFYTEKPVFTIDFIYEDVYVGLRAGDQTIHLKRVDAPDPSIPYVEEGGHLHLYLSCDDIAAFAERLKANDVALVSDVHETAWHTREVVLRDDQGHTVHFGAAVQVVGARSGVTTAAQTCDLASETFSVDEGLHAA